MKAEQLLNRGKGNYINCTDYDDAIEAMEKYAEFKRQELLKEIIGEIEDLERVSFHPILIRLDQVLNILNTKLKEDGK